MKKFFKTVLCLGLIGAGTMFAIQFQPVRDGLKKIGIPL